MKRLGLFVIALVFAFCTTVMAAEPVAAPAAPAAEKAAPMKAEKKKVKKMKKMKKAKKAEEKKMEEAAPAANNHLDKKVALLKEARRRILPRASFITSTLSPFSCKH